MNRYLRAKLLDEIEVRPFAPADAIAVIDLLYKTYGYTYRGLEGAYDPDAVAARFGRPDARSLVAAEPSGRVVGFCACVPRGAGGLEVEIEMLAVDPDARTGPVGKRLALAMGEEARRRAPKAVTSLITRHPQAQRTILALDGFAPLAIEPGVHPADLAFRGAPEGGERQRETLLFGGWMLAPPPRRAVYLPPRHAAMIRELYDLHRLDRDQLDPRAAPPPDQHSELEVSIRPGWLAARIDVRRAGSDLVERVAAAKKDLDEGFVEQIDLRLPLDSPLVASPELEKLEALGFFFCGIDAETATPAGPPGDVLRLAALARPIDFARVHLEPIAEPLGRYVARCAPPPPSRRAVGAAGVPVDIREARAEAVRHLAAGLSHEINNPLNIILGATYQLRQRLKDGRAPGELEEDVRSIEQEVARVSKLIEAVRRFAAPEDAPRAPIDLERTIADALALVEGAFARSRGIGVARRFSGDLPPVLGHQGQLQQLFLQLALNAFDASPDGAEVVFETRREGRSAVALVRDEGRGIAAGDLARIFDPFFTTKDPGAGTGLGLSIARAIAAAHGGALEVESPGPGRGATARVTLPLAPAAAPPASPPSRLPAEIGEGGR